MAADDDAYARDRSRARPAGETRCRRGAGPGDDSIRRGLRSGADHRQPADGARPRRYGRPASGAEDRPGACIFRRVDPIGDRRAAAGPARHREDQDSCGIDLSATERAVMTMDRHVEIAERLDAYVLDQLPGLERREVEEHLQGCAACAKDVHELRAVLEGVAESVPPAAPPAALRERVLAAVATELQEPVRRERRGGIVQQPRRPLWAMVALAAAAVLVLAIGAV